MNAGSSGNRFCSLVIWPGYIVTQLISDPDSLRVDVHEFVIWAQFFREAFLSCLWASSRRVQSLVLTIPKQKGRFEVMTRSARDCG